IYNFATGYRLTGLQEYRDAVERGAVALIEHFGTDDPGMWLWAVDESGRPLDAHFSAYGHAFVVFGLAHAFAATGEERFRDAAQATAHALATRFRDEHGGIIPTLAATGSDTGAVRSQNPIMHLFEALLTLGHEAGDGDALEAAAALAEWVFRHLMRDDAILPEVYSRDWQPLPEGDGGRIDVGHQFEWAFLLSRAVEIGAVPPRAVATGRRMLENGLRLGYDARDGGIWSPAMPDGRIVNRSKGWWEQCEAARALHRYASAHQCPTCAAARDATLALCRGRFVDPEHGGWFMRIEPDGTIPSTDKGNEWKVDYHVVGLCVELMA
ncbi:MAG: AGE family epimerase/isomerase, partial [Rubrivivax sp.]|nr:AGE family epimerase/isomerase [Rubrivivax sp.]